MATTFQAEKPCKMTRTGREDMRRKVDLDFAEGDRWE